MSVLGNIYFASPGFLRKIFGGIYKAYKDFGADMRRALSERNFQKALIDSSEGKIEDLNIFEQKIYSQHGEDGISRAIFEKIGTVGKFCVEFGVGNGSECNTRYFIEKEGWDYLHMDAGDTVVPFTDIKREFITAENINNLFAKYTVPREFDLLSIDIDYNDYWIWKAIEDYRPRVVIIEYNASIPFGESRAVKYNPEASWDGTNYFGASLSAYIKLAEEKGYKLIGCDSTGVNAFFVTRELADKHFALKDAKQLYKPPRYGAKEGGEYIGHPPNNKNSDQWINI
ncbi:MAG: hypothetical protein R3251_00555 [Candidatus Spechtbacterales bacterium]|nr:hypothetical protein [Candidatus Spechtbacterales bacterium]